MSCIDTLSYGGGCYDPSGGQSVGVLFCLLVLQDGVRVCDVMIVRTYTCVDAGASGHKKPMNYERLCTSLEQYNNRIESVVMETNGEIHF